MAKRKKQKTRENNTAQKRPARTKPSKKPVWPWVLGVVILAAILLIVAGGMWQRSTPSTFNCLKLCYQRENYDGASGVSFDATLGWAEFDKERRIGFSFPPATMLGFNIDAPPIGRLDYSVAISAGAFRETEHVELVVSFISENGRLSEIDRQGFDLLRADTAGHWRNRSVEFPQHLGMGKLNFEVRGLSDDAPGGTVFIGNPRIVNLDQRSRSRIIVIAVDTLRADHLGCYGYERDTSPNIDSLAEGGTLFENCIATSPWTFTSFASMFSGQYPSTNGATTVSKLFPDNTETFAEILSGKGFLTGAVSNNVWFSPSFNLLQGFDSHRDFANIAEHSFEYAKNWLFENRDVDCMFFIHIVDPHLPYSPPGEWAKKYGAEYRGPYETAFSGVEEYRAGKLEIPPQLNDHLIDLYDGEIAYMDAALGKFISALETTFLMEGTTVIFTADHGEEFFDHGSFEHGHTMYNELLHVPLIIKGNGFKAGAKVDKTVSPMDLFATLLGRYGAVLPGDVPSIDLADVIKGDAGKGRNIYSEQIYFGDEQSALTDGKYKYIYHLNDGAEELYDLESDPKETVNLSEDQRATARDRRQFVQNFIAAHQAGFHIRFNRKHQEDGDRFKGTITSDSMISGIVQDRLDKGDIFSFDSNKIIFDIRMPEDIEKGFVFQIDDPSAEVHFDVEVDDDPDDVSLVHIGAAKQVVSSGIFTLTMDDERFSLGQPVMLRAKDPGMYIWAINPGLVESPWENLSSEEEEQLRNLGYLSG